ncbi:MAG: PilZ domain-containing protein [Candidatus Acidiferrales bacterium]|jgi:hypothetical protein
MKDASHLSGDLGWSNSAPRTVPRYSVLAIAELVETAGAMCIVGRISEISRKGCYVNTPSTVPVNTVLKIVISRDGGTFVTNGKVIYLHERVGMGVVFVDSPEDQMEILDAWLADAALSKW